MDSAALLLKKFSIGIVISFERLHKLKLKRSYLQEGLPQLNVSFCAAIVKL